VREPAVTPERSRTAPRPAAVAIAPRTLVAFVALVAAAVALARLAWAVQHTLVQLTVAIVLAMALEPLVHVFERRGLGRGRAVGVAFALVAAAVLVFVVLLLQPLVSELRAFAHDLPSLFRELTHGRGRLGFLESRYHVIEAARRAVQKHGVSGATGLVSAVLSTGGSVVFVAFLTLFVLLGGGEWFRSVLALVPSAYRPRVQRAGAGVSRAVGGYVAGNLLISVIAGTVATVVLLATGVPYALPLGLLVGVFDLIPLVGATIATVLVGAVALTQGVPEAAIVVVTLIAYQQVENHSLQQLVYHRTVQLSPLGITVAVAAGAELGGVLGALLGIPAAGALKVVFGEIADWRAATRG
jgi:predicted PurR-regulated permease PerM